MTPTGRTSLLRQASGWVKTRVFLRTRIGQANRRLEIGPGIDRIAGFEGLGAVAGPAVDYLWDCARPLPFSDGTFEIVYASHVLEHIAWYRSATVLKEWARVVAPNGWLEIWVPDALKIVTLWIEAEAGEADPFASDNWTRFNDSRDPALWAAGRIFTYGDGTGRIDDHNWHRALFGERLLTELLVGAGLTEITRMSPSECRGYDHGWINLGIKGRKPVA